MTVLIPICRRSGGRRRRHSALSRNSSRHILEASATSRDKQSQSQVSGELRDVDESTEHKDALHLANLCKEMDDQNSGARCVLLLHYITPTDFKSFPNRLLKLLDVYDLFQLLYPFYHASTKGKILCLLSRLQRATILLIRP